MTITPLKKEKEFGPNKVIVLLRPNNGKYRVQFNIAKDNLNGFECACRSGNGINRKEYDPIPEKTVNGAESNCYIRKDEFDFLENALDEVRVILYGRPSSRIS